MAEDATNKEEEVQDRPTEMFLVSDFNVIKKLLGYTSYPSRIFLYQMPNKATSYVDETIDKATDLMNSLLEYHRTEDWRIDSCVHVSNWKINDNTIELDTVQEKSGKEIHLSFSGMKEAIVVSDLHSLVIVPEGDNIGDMMPNQVVRFVGLVKQNFLKCLLVGEDDKEHAGKRILSMKFEAVD